MSLYFQSRMVDLVVDSVNFFKKLTAQLSTEDQEDVTGGMSYAI